MKRLAVLVSLALLSGCQPRTPAPQKKPSPDAKPSPEAKPSASPDEHEGIALSESARRSAGIRTEPATQRSVEATRDVPGVVEVAANRSVKITPSAAGKVVSLLAKPGDSVRAGQTLATLDSFEVAQAHAAVEQAEANVAQAMAAIQTAQAEARQATATVAVADSAIDQARERAASARQALARQKELAAAGAFAQAPLQAAQTELAEAQSELLKSQTELQGHLIVLQRAERLFREEIVSRAELEQAQLEHRQDEANVETAKRRVDNARLTLDRERKIASAGLLNARETQTAEAVLRDTEADVRKARSERGQSVEAGRKALRGVDAARTGLLGARAALRAARTSLYALEGPDHAPGQGGRVVVTSPIAAIVAERAVTQGEAVDRTTVLFTLQNESVVQVTAQVPEAQIGRVRVGRRAKISVAAFPGERFSGTIQSVGSRIDEKTRALPVRLLVDNPGGRLKAGLFVSVTLGLGGSRAVVAVPESALVEIEGKPHVFIEENGKFEERDVKTGARSGGFVEIMSGVQAGERVVVDGAFVLKSESNKESLAGHEH